MDADPMSSEIRELVPGFTKAWRSSDVRDKNKKLVNPEELRAQAEERKKIKKEKIEKLEQELVKFENKVNFVVTLRDSFIELRSLSKNAIVEALKDCGFVAFPEKDSEKFKGYDYLVTMPLGLLIYPEAFDKLCAERDLAKATLALETKLALELEAKYPLVD